MGIGKKIENPFRDKAIKKTFLMKIRKLTYKHELPTH
jgi:hypothetical protein